MKKVLAFFVFIYLLVSIPTAIASSNEHSTNDGEQEKKLGFLGQTLKKTTESIDRISKETVKSTVKTVTDVADYTQSTVEVLTSIDDRKPVKTIVHSTVELVGKTTTNAVPIVGTVTDTVTETVTTTTEELNQTIDKLPTIPVVTPVVKEVKKVVDRTTSSVVGVVDETVDSVTTKRPSMPSVVPVVEEVRKTTTTIIPSEEKQPVTPVVNPTPAETDVSVDKYTPEIVLPREETRNDITLEHVTEAISPAESVSSEGKNDEKQPTIRTTTILLTKSHPSTSLPLGAEKDWTSDTWAVITIGNSSTPSTSFGIASNGDSTIGVLFDVFLLSTSTGKQWVHPDDDAVMQWTHAPPGRPPQTTPFLYVNLTH